MCNVGLNIIAKQYSAVNNSGYRVIASRCQSIQLRPDIYIRWYQPVILKSLLNTISTFVYVEVLQLDFTCTNLTKSWDTF